MARSISRSPKRRSRSTERKRASPRRRSPSPAVTKIPGIPERERLERHRGAQRDTRPAWMTKGCGVNKDFFGETKGDLVKPGMTQADLDKIVSTVRSDSPDPMSDFMKKRSNVTESPPRTNP